MPEKSMYAELWETIKQNSLSVPATKTIIAAHRPMHPRIIKAVTKRKDVDVGFKFQCADEGKGRSVLQHISAGNQITFWLIFNRPVHEDDL